MLDAPTVFNTRMLHAVPRPLTDTDTRWILMMDLFDWIDHVFKKVDNDTIWNDTENFKYEA